ncbi:hypothetical protein VT84_08735 [Gemmata sp. SH-PL17]|uniref:hypothetical protein n=1 Tax=Gemmata sp. SH-PL17 TaxID=1630693 RepID=UPI000698F3F0|nr:hypothetical protein [Gemmata sp. SH-PL17]AMV24469.1 hypothetical protein VT84_08735 [Gemmata sp. SH-PL17]
MGKPARPSTLVREQEQFATRAIESLRAIPQPSDEAGAAEHLFRLQFTASALVIALQVRWQNGIGDHTEPARQIVAVARDAVAVRQRFPGAPSTFPFHHAAWFVYLLDGTFDAELIAQFPVPEDLTGWWIDYPFMLGDACLLNWLRTRTPHPDWEALLDGRLERRLPTAHLSKTYQAYSDAVRAIFTADQAAFTEAVREAERLYDKRWRISYEVPEGGIIMNPKARGRDFRLAALLEYARRTRPEWTASVVSSHQWAGHEAARISPVESLGS